MPDSDISRIIARQYGASLAMLGRAVETCPESLWLSEDHLNRFWHVAYHALFYTHLYLQTSEADFRPWDKHRKDYQHLGQRPGATEEAARPNVPYSRDEVIEYHRFCREEVIRCVPALDLEAPSGFSWLPFNKLELQFYNVRHIHHHVGQLADRLRTSAGVGLGWVRM